VNNQKGETDERGEIDAVELSGENDTPVDNSNADADSDSDLEDESNSEDPKATWLGRVVNLPNRLSQEVGVDV
jgi:hypothetical protein